MIADIDTLFAEALALSDDARLQLVERLIPTIQSEPSLEVDQIQEVQRRMEDVRSGRVKTISGEQVFRDIDSRRGELFAPLATMPDRDLSDVVNENRGDA